MFYIPRYYRRLLDIVHADQKLYLVFEFLDVDLKRYIETGNQNRTPIPRHIVKVSFSTAFFFSVTRFGYGGGKRVTAAVNAFRRASLDPRQTSALQVVVLVVFKALGACHAFLPEQSCHCAWSLSLVVDNGHQ